MKTRQPRIMIIENDMFQRLSIEKMLNGLGYYAVTCMSSAAEVFSVLSYASNAFDLVIANRKLAADAEYDLKALFERHPFIRQALVYDSSPVFTPTSDGGVESVSSREAGSIQVCI